ncbi:hypothetical protein [Rhizobium johnstonii]|uniref:hypothetical protein n=1 Tax=Rhizobium johnstonii TaxID=3019933 RepID=UPI003F948E3B
MSRLAGSASDGSAGLEKFTAGNIHVLIPFEILVWRAWLRMPGMPEMITPRLRVPFFRHGLMIINFAGTAL